MKEHDILELSILIRKRISALNAMKFIEAFPLEDMMPITLGNTPHRIGFECNWAKTELPQRLMLEALGKYIAELNIEIRQKGVWE